MNHLYRQLTWTEVREAAAQKTVILIPVAAIEQHGHRLSAALAWKLRSPRPAARDLITQQRSSK
jgi:hypothetical protein